MRVKLGARVIDVITNYRGTATARLERLHGSTDVLVEPRGVQENGSPLVAHWIVETRLREDVDK